LIRDSSVSDFIAAASKQLVRVRTPHAAELSELLGGPGVTVAGFGRGQLEVTGLSSENIGSRAAEAGLAVYELAPVEASLEQAFMDLTKDEVEYRSTTENNNSQPAPDDQEVAA
jgi:ABC-2 type transport system ATP-binding protein